MRPTTRPPGLFKIIIFFMLPVAAKLDAHLIVAIKHMSALLLSLQRLFQLLRGERTRIGVAHFWAPLTLRIATGYATGAVAPERIADLSP